MEKLIHIMLMKVKILSTDLEGNWSGYVNESGMPTFYHHIGWKHAIEQTFGHKAYYLLADDSGKICGILPLFLLKSVMFGRLLISLPYAVYGGVCADTSEAGKLLIDEAIRIAVAEKVRYLEFRNTASSHVNLPQRELYVTFIKELPESPGDCLAMLPRKARAAARKSINYGLDAEFGLQNLKDCYALYARNKRDLGSPFLPFLFFENLVQQFREQSTVLCVRYQGKVVASVLTFFFKNTVIPYYSGSLPEYHEYQTNNFMYLKLMEYGVENGYKYFDFGRSRKDSGSYHFKRHQGFEPQQLHYQYYLNRAKEIPDVSPSNPKFSLPRLIWRKLPVSFARALSASIVRRMPY